MKELSTDDLSATADWHPDYAEARQALVYYRPERLVDVLADAGEALPVRAIAAWYHAGTDRLPRYRIPPRRGDVGRGMSVFGELGVLGRMLQVCRVAAGRTRCPLPVMLPLLWLAHRDAAGGTPVQSIARRFLPAPLSGASRPIFLTRTAGRAGDASHSS